MQIFIQHDGVQEGPYSPDAVRLLLRDGSILRSDLARHDAKGEWMQLEALLGIEIGSVRVPHTSVLAVWCLNLGILGILTLGIPSIAAIICGHLSLGKIKRSAGLLTGKGLAIAGLVLGYIGVVIGPLLIAAGFAAGNVAITKAKKAIAMATAVAIESAVNNFYA